MSGLENRPSIGKRALVSLILSIVFLVVYGGTQAITVGRSNVPSFFYAWERRVPFVAATIIPYLSIDLFFITAPLLIETERKLRAYAIRITTAILVGGMFFLSLPLRFAFQRPDVAGVSGYVFKQFQQLDQPFNQFPSLHIALLLIVGDVFIQRTRGWVRGVLLIWFGLIAASPLLVYQHHLIDLIGGLALGLVCLRVVNDNGERITAQPHWRIGGYYLVTAAVLVSLSLWIGKASWPLWWPAFSLLFAAGGYFLLGPRIYAKRDGRLPLSTRLLFGPMLIGQAASWWWYARRAWAYDVLTDRLLIGRLLTSEEAAAACEAGVGAVVDLTCEFSEPPEYRSLPYLHVPVLDLTAPTPEQIDRAVAFIQEHEVRSIVYLHCKAGYSRTAVIAAAYLLATGRAESADDAIDQLRRARPSMIVRPEARRAIKQFAATTIQAQSLVER